MSKSSSMGEADPSQENPGNAGTMSRRDFIRITTTAGTAMFVGPMFA